jgi:hypothetical protein
MRLLGKKSCKDSQYSHNLPKFRDKSSLKDKYLSYYQPSLASYRLSLPLLRSKPFMKIS